MKNGIYFEFSNAMDAIGRIIIEPKGIAVAIIALSLSSLISTVIAKLIGNRLQRKTEKLS